MRLVAGILALAVAAQAFTNYHNIAGGIGYNDVMTHDNDVIGYRPGQQYRYEYRAVSLSGIPLGSNDRTGLAIWCNVLVLFQTGNTVVLQLENPVLRELNTDQPDYFWTRGRIPEYSERPEVFTPLTPEVDTLATEKLSRPIVFTLGQDGLVRDLKVVEDEPEWVLNIKKAVVNQFQIQRVQTVEQKTEDTIIGSGCTVNYDLTKTGDNHYNITKDFGLKSCEHVARFRDIIGVSGHLTDETDDILTTSFLTRLETSLSENRHFLKRCVSEGRYTLRPFSPEFGEIVTYTRQEMEFVCAEPKTVTVPQNVVKRYSTIFAPLIDRENPITDVYSLNHLLTEQQKLGLVKKLLSTIVEEISREKEWMAEGETDLMMQLVHLLRGFKSQTSFVQITDFCLRPENEPRMRPVMISAFAHCGSPALVSALPALRQKLTVSEFNMIITAIPSTHMPTVEVVNNLITFYGQISERRVKDQILLTTGSLVYGICKPHQMGQIKPGVVCSNDLKIKTVKFFTQEYTLAKTDVERIVILRAIGNSGLEMTNFLKTLIVDETLPVEIRESAIIAMRRCYDLDKLVQTLLPVFRNEDPKYPSELRIVAFSTLVERVPTAEMLTKLTARMNEETCRQVGNYVYSYLTNLVELPTIFEPSKELVTVAQNVLPTIRRFEDGVMFSKNVKYLIASLSRRMAKLINIDVLNVHSQFMPRAMTLRVWDFCAGYYTNMLEAGFRFEGLDKLVQQVFQTITQSGDASSDFLSTIIGDRYKRDLTYVQNLLSEDEIVDRPIEQTRGFLFLRYFGNEIGIFHTDRYTLNDIQTSLSQISSLRDPLRIFNVIPVSPTMTLKIQSLVGMPFGAHYHAMAVFDFGSRTISNENGIVARSFTPRILFKIMTRVGTDFGLVKTLVGHNAHLKAVIPVNVLVTRGERQISTEVYLNPQDKLMDKTLLEISARPVVNKIVINPAHLVVEQKTRNMILPLVNNVINMEREYMGLKMTLMTHQQGLTFRMPLFPLCGRHLLRLQWSDLRYVKPFGFKSIFSYDLTNYKYETQMLFNPRVPTVSTQLNTRFFWTLKNKINLPMVGVEIEPKWTPKILRFFLTTEIKSGKINPGYSWIEAGEEKPIEMIFRAQYGDGIEYNPQKEDILIKTTFGKSELQKELEYLDSEIETSDCYKCEKYQDTWRNVYCDRCIYKRSWLSQIDMKMFYDTQKTWTTDYPMTIFTQWATPYLNMWETEFGRYDDIKTSLLSTSRPILSHSMSHLSSDKLGCVRLVSDWHPYMTEKNLTIYWKQDKIVLSRIPVIPSFRRLDNLRENRFTDVATDRFFMPNFGTCSLDGMDQLTTLDALREEMPEKTDCEQLLVKDCTKQRRFEITTKLVDNKRWLKVLLREIPLEIRPTPIGYDVLINNQPRPFVNGRIETPQFVITLEHVTSPQKTQLPKLSVFVKTEMIKCTVFGDLVNVQVPFWLKDQVCGLCGDFNGEVVHDLKLPNKTPATSLAEFVESYTSKDCPHLSSHLRNRH